MPLNKELYIGIDGGGTKTQCVVGNSYGDILAFVEVGSTNIKSNPPAFIESQIHLLLKQVMEQIDITPECIKGIFVSTAGGDRREDVARWKQWMTSFHEQLTCPILVSNDAVSALKSGTASSSGTVLIAGTGSIVYAVPEEAAPPIRVGGWGYLFGDEGSGFAIGREALRSIMKAYDGRGEKTELTETIMEFLHLQHPSGFVTAIYESTSPRQTVASLARPVLKLASTGDPVAVQLVGKEIEGLLDLLRASVRHHSALLHDPLVLTGGLFQSSYFKQRFVQAIEQNNLHKELIFPTFPPVVGAYLYMLEKSGHPNIRERVGRSWLENIGIEATNGG
ncbi:N-acetylglucosamine kinase [Radiobacillus deserti]|uniref:N-acetylglucosamine kinase n=1 Tax=Radiobacillus deserti TaxID=2594883 RepID=UPI0013157DBF|nr:BadF/BadG/BcrA/BcrD ATPase family protein [Radiobacillus deserti]